MPAKDLGTKHTCWKCGTKFYDLKKPAPACPKCGADPRQAPTAKAPAAEKKRAAKPAPEPEIVEEAELDDEVDEPDEDAGEDADDE